MSVPLEGTSLELSSNHPLMLDPQGAWYVERGEVDLFSVLWSGGDAAGPRRYLASVGPGRLLLGLDPGPYRRALVAVASHGTRLVQTARSRLPGPQELQPLLEGWIGALWTALARGRQPPACVELAAAHEIDLAESTLVRAGLPVAFVRQVSGRSLVGGQKELALESGELLPVAAPGWIEVQPPARLQVLELAELGGPEAFWQALDRLHRLVSKHVALQAEEHDRACQARLRLLSLSSQATMQRACARLAGAMRPGGEPSLTLTHAPLSLAPDPSQEALFACCRLVVKTLGLSIKAPWAAEGKTVLRDPLGAILRSSRLRARRVALRSDWWRHDHGPLLAFADGGGRPRPVALLRDGGGYLMHRPAGTALAGAQERAPGAGPTPPRAVDADVAAGLDPFAYTFYRPFPDVGLGLWSLLKFGARGCGRDGATLVTMALLVSLLSMVPSLATGLLFNSVIPGAHRSQLWQMTALLVVCGLASAGFFVVRGVALLRIQERMGPGVQAAVWDRLMRLPLPFFRPYTAGDLALRAMSIDAIHNILSGTTLTAILSGVFSLGNVAMMLHFSPAMTWRALLLLAAAVLVTALGGLLQLGPQRAMLGMEVKTSGLVLQLLTSISKLRVAGAEARAFARWVERFARQRRLQFKSRMIGNWLSAFSAAFPVLASLLMYRAALPPLAAGELRTGDFLAFAAAFSACLAALLGSCAALLSSLSIISLYEQAKPILQALPEVHRGRSDPGLLSGDIEVQHAVFRYHQDGPPALRDVSLHVRPGEFVAFVGASGSGKSTLLKLLLGFETLESGSIYFDGQEIGGLDVQEVRRQMGVVLQNSQLIVGDIFTNIVGAGNATLDEAWEAAELAGIADDVRAMPMQMHTVIGEQASTLSGGQRQRLMIARAIVNRPRILLFDEATSALDNRTQALVTASLERLQATRVVVAHRLSTIANADRIFVIDRGRIAQCGSYRELMKEAGPFSELARRQLA